MSFPAPGCPPRTIWAPDLHKRNYRTQLLSSSLLSSSLLSSSAPQLSSAPLAPLAQLSSEAPERIFDAVRQVVAATGVLKGRTRRALDSTVLDDAVARQDTVTMIATQIRRVRRLVPALEGVWVREHNLEPGRPPCDWDDPADIERLVSELVDDANELVWAAGDLDLDEDQAQAVALLALVAGQDVEPAGPPGSGKWRIAEGTAPDRVISTVDPESRHAHRPLILTVTATRPMSRSSPTPGSSPRPA